MIEITAEIRAFIDKAAAGVELAEDEYIDPSDGLIHCKKCGGQRQTVVPCFGKYSYTISLAKNREIAEEITQNIFYKAVSTTSQFKGKSDELTWLCSIAKNLYHDEMRSRQRVADVSEINDLPSNENVENSVADSDMAFRIHLVLHRFEEPYKEVFQLRVFGELSFSQIAAIFGKTESWARVTYHRAKLKIQERMDEKHE